MDFGMSFFFIKINTPNDQIHHISSRGRYIFSKICFEILKVSSYIWKSQKVWDFPFHKCFSKMSGFCRYLHLNIFCHKMRLEIFFFLIQLLYFWKLVNFIDGKTHPSSKLVMHSKNLIFVLSYSKEVNF